MKFLGVCVFHSLCCIVDDPIGILWNPVKLRNTFIEKHCLWFAWFIVLYLESFSMLYVTYAYQNLTTGSFFDAVMSAIALHIVNILNLFSSNTP